MTTAPEDGGRPDPAAGEPLRQGLNASVTDDAASMASIQAAAASAGAPPAATAAPATPAAAGGEEDPHTPAGSAARTPEVRSALLSSAKAKVLKAVARNPHQYFQGLGGLYPHAQPSTLQGLVKRGTHAPSVACRPPLSDTGLALRDVRVGEDQMLAEDGPPAAAVRLMLLGVRQAPKVGPNVLPAVKLARLCFYKGGTFLGNVHKVVGDTGPNFEDWGFADRAVAGDPVVILRADEELVPKLKVYFEFNVSCSLTQADEKRLYRNAHKRAQQVNEVTSGWCTVPYATLLRQAPYQALEVKLVAGSLFQPKEIEPARRRFFSFAKTEGRFRLKVLPRADARPWERNLPKTIITDAQYGSAIAVYRLLLGRLVAAGASVNAVASDPVLRCFPAIIDDSDMWPLFYKAWQDQGGGGEGAKGKGKGGPATPREVEERRVALFRALVLRFWPLFTMGKAAPMTIENDGFERSMRQKQIGKFLDMGVDAALSAEGVVHAFRSFDASEMRFCCADWKGPSA